MFIRLYNTMSTNKMSTLGTEMEKQKKKNAWHWLTYYSVLNESRASVKVEKTNNFQGFVSTNHETIVQITKENQVQIHLITISY